MVIIESFADLRSEEAGESSGKQQDKPAVVLYEQKGNTNEISFKHIKTQESLTAFKNKLNKYYYCIVEKAFIVLVLVDAIVTALKHTGMSQELADVLRYWQVGVVRWVWSETGYMCGMCFCPCSEIQYLLCPNSLMGQA